MLKTAKNETKAFPKEEDFYYANDITLVWQQVRHSYLKNRSVRFPVSPESSPLSTAPLPEKSGKWMTSWP